MPRGGPPPIRSNGGTAPAATRQGAPRQTRILERIAFSILPKATPFRSTLIQLTAVSTTVSAITFSWGVLWVDAGSPHVTSKLIQDIGNAIYAVLYWIIVLCLLWRLFSIDFPFLARQATIRMLNVLGVTVAVVSYVFRVMYPDSTTVRTVAAATTYITTGWSFLVAFKFLAVHTSRAAPDAIPTQQKSWIFFVLLITSNLAYVGVHFNLKDEFYVLPLGICVFCGFFASFYALRRASQGKLPPKQVDMAILVYSSMHICPLLIRLSQALLATPVGKSHTIWIIFLYRGMLSLGSVCVDDLVDIMTGEFSLILAYHVRFAESLASTAAKVNTITGGYDALIYNAIDMVITALRDGGITDDVRFYLTHNKIWFFSSVVRTGRTSKVTEAQIKSLRRDLQYQIARSEHNLVARVSATLCVLVCYCLAVVYQHTIQSIVRVVPGSDHIVPIGILIGGLVDVWISRYFADRLLVWKANVLEQLERGVFRKTVEATAAAESGSSAMALVGSQPLVSTSSLQAGSHAGSQLVGGTTTSSASANVVSPSQAQAISMSESTSTQLSVPLVKIHRDSNGKGAASGVKKSTATSRVGLRQSGFPKRAGFRETVLLSTAFVATAFFGMWST